MYVNIIKNCTTTLEMCDSIYRQVLALKGRANVNTNEQT